MTRFYLVRHGETVWNSLNRFQGHQDVPLSDAGRRQASSLSSKLNNMPIDVAYCSDLSRASDTATVVLAGRNVPVRTRPELREASFGRWEGLTYADVFANYPDEVAARRQRPAEVPPPGGESLAALADRIRAEIDLIATAHPDGSVLIVSHGGPIRVFLGILLGLPLESYWKIRVDNCSLSIVDSYPEGAIVSLLNDICHLPILEESRELP